MQLRPHFEPIIGRCSVSRVIRVDALVLMAERGKGDIEMTKMIQFVDDMRARLTEVANNEQTLIRALGDALGAVDQQLLADVRDLTLAHEARRVAILQELQILASRIGAFPTPREPQPALETNGHALPVAPPGDEMEGALRGGDWRQAVSNIKDELEEYFNRSVPH